MPGEREAVRDEIALALATTERRRWDVEHSPHETHAEVFARMRDGLDRYADAVAAPLQKALEEREYDMHARIRAGYDKTVADSWRAANEAAWLAAWDAEYRAQVTRAPLVDLLRRAAVGLQRHCDGHAPMRIPADAWGDSDIVLDDIRAALAAYEAGK